MKVHLVDGTFELFRAHFGAPSASAPDGMEVGATRGLLRSLLTLVEGREVTHVAAAFDSVIESFRNQLFDGYKSGEGIEEVLLRQFSLAERAAHALGITVWPMVDLEADDGLAGGAAHYATCEQVEQVVIASPDKDLAQCVVGDRVVVWDRMRGVVRDDAGVLEKFGVEPASIPDWLGLVGDAADGIPGVPRWGAKSSASVLRHYHHVADIPDDHEQWQVRVRGAAGLAKSLCEHREQAELWVKLATLRTDPPKESLDELRWQGARRAELEALCDDIGESRLVGRIPRWRED